VMLRGITKCHVTATKQQRLTQNPFPVFLRLKECKAAMEPLVGHI